MTSREDFVNALRDKSDPHRQDKILIFADLLAEEVHEDLGRFVRMGLKLGSGMSGRDAKAYMELTKLWWNSLLGIDYALAMPNFFFLGDKSGVRIHFHSGCPDYRPLVIVSATFKNGIDVELDCPVFWWREHRDAVTRSCVVTSVLFDSQDPELNDLHHDDNEKALATIRECSATNPEVKFSIRANPAYFVSPEMPPETRTGSHLA